MKNLISSESILPVLTSEKNNSGAEFTVRSKATGKDFTFKIARSLWNGKFYTHVKVEKGYLDFSYLGSYFNGKVFNKRQVVNTPAATAITWVLNKVMEQKFSLLDNNVEIMHLGKCLKCGKTLTDAESISFGLGPVCRGH